jgi:DMSO/TMAO reductase YedYZ heme-binding membrane subunit
MAGALFMMAYHDWWRAKTYSLGTANESLALSAVFCMSLALSLGPLRRLFGLRPALVRLRRPLGVWSVVLALAHSVVTLVVMSNKYDWAYFRAHLDLLVLGISALALLLMLGVTSWPFALRKFGGWVAWFQKRDKPAPPGTMWAFLAGVLAFIVRAADWLRSLQRAGVQTP